jgi:hypothetical protein
VKLNQIDYIDASGTVVNQQAPEETASGRQRWCGSDGWRDSATWEALGSVRLFALLAAVGLSATCPTCCRPLKVAHARRDLDCEAGQWRSDLNCDATMLELLRLEEAEVAHLLQLRIRVIDDVWTKFDATESRRELHWLTHLLSERR